MSLRTRLAFAAAVASCLAAVIAACGGGGETRTDGGGPDASSDGILLQRTAWPRAREQVRRRRRMRRQRAVLRGRVGVRRSVLRLGPGVLVPEVRDARRPVRRLHRLRARRVLRLHAGRRRRRSGTDRSRLHERRHVWRAACRMPMPPICATDAGTGDGGSSCLDRFAAPAVQNPYGLVATVTNIQWGRATFQGGHGRVLRRHGSERHAPPESATAQTLYAAQSGDGGQAATLTNPPAGVADGTQPLYAVVDDTQTPIQPGTNAGSTTIRRHRLGCAAAT